MAIIVTYDVNDKHQELKQILFDKGYSDKIPHTDEGKPRPVYLPNTVVYHTSKTTEQGIDDVKAAAKSLGVKLERCIAVPADGWRAIWGEPFKASLSSFFK